MADSLANRGKKHSPHGAPLPVRDGLNATRARVPVDSVSAWDFVWHLISTQRHRDPSDNEDALRDRFAAGEVVLRDGTRLQPTSVVTRGQDVYFYRRPASEVPVPYDIPIIFEDDHILVADKPPFMATMPRARHIVETATVRLRRATGNSELSPAHRLDRLTSGVLLFTKDRSVRGAYQTMFAERRVSKTYQAIAEYRDFITPLLWETRIEKVPGEIQGRLVDGPINAVTTLADAVLLSPTQQRALESVHGPQPPLGRYVLQPATGKTHQLRLHMWRAGVPILGDPVYPEILPESAEDMTVPMHLLAKSISFTDPITGAERTFTSERE